MRELPASNSLSIKSAADRGIRRQLREEEDDEDDEEDDKKEEGDKNEPILMDQDKTRRQVVPVEQLIKLNYSSEHFSEKLIKFRKLLFVQTCFWTTAKKTSNRKSCQDSGWNGCIIRN